MTYGACILKELLSLWDKYSDIFNMKVKLLQKAHLMQNYEIMAVLKGVSTFHYFI